MQPLTLKQIADAIGAELRGDPSSTVTSICTDTRHGCSGSLFFALKGERSDGHVHVPHALASGAVAAVVGRPLDGVAGPLLIVGDPLRALADLAAWYARRFEPTVVGVTGSVGKTTVRQMIAACLGGPHRVHASSQNHNNEIGLPLTLLGLEPEHTVLVAEMAMRGPGQITYLAGLARPSVGVITNIGLSHIELLGSREAIACAKAELVDALPADGVAVLPADDAYFAFLSSRARCRVLGFGLSEGADFRAENVRMAADGSLTCAVCGVPVRLRVGGVHNAVNTAAAFAVGATLGVSAEECAEGLNRFRPPDMRLALVEAPGGVTIISDCYNAAPDSMRAALGTLEAMARMRGRRAVAVLGDMRELGEWTERAHREIGSLPEIGDLGLLLTVGPAARTIAEVAVGALGAERVLALDTASDACEALHDRVRDGDLVLVKGSRALAMEAIVEALAKRNSEGTANRAQGA